MSNPRFERGLLLSDSGIQVALKEERLGGEEESQHPCGVDNYHSPEGCTIAQELGNHTTQQDTQSLPISQEIRIVELAVPR